MLPFILINCIASHKLQIFCYNSDAQFIQTQNITDNVMRFYPYQAIWFPNTVRLQSQKFNLNKNKVGLKATNAFVNNQCYTLLGYNHFACNECVLEIKWWFTCWVPFE